MMVLVVRCKHIPHEITTVNLNDRFCETFEEVNFLGACLMNVFHFFVDVFILLTTV